SLRVWRRLLENSLSAKVSCWLIRLLILGSGYNTMISHLGLIRTFLNYPGITYFLLRFTEPAFRLYITFRSRADLLLAFAPQLNAENLARRAT
ncbi:hypothetical protein, partial [Klebsiella pneumoniae]|uniref:hypothetical protein n=1 Tax=Klebsiella pneumoniae TaxID=573 RepID=UPI001C4E2BF9